MPIRSTRPRKNEGLKQFIPMLYERPTLRFLSGKEYAPIADLIYGPIGLYTDKFFNEDVRQEGFKRLAALQQLWAELKDDLLEAQRRYQPDKKPWGARFERKAFKIGKNQTQVEISTAIAAIVALLPTDQQITIALRYGDGQGEIKKIIAEARQRIEEIKNKLQKAVGKESNHV